MQFEHRCWDVGSYESRSIEEVIYPLCLETCEAARSGQSATRAESAYVRHARSYERDQGHRGKCEVVVLLC